MDQQIYAFLEALVLEVLNIHQFKVLADEKKKEIAGKLRDRFSMVVVDTVLDNLSEEQLEALKDLPVESSDFALKIQEFSAQIPGLGAIIEENLKIEVEKIKKNPYSVNNLE